ncbi:MAG: murein biosynthesis integral membrane protein MurJ [Chlamydiota bacterium]
MAKESYTHISKYARHFFSGTLLSRISGMVRDISMAALFGDHPSVAAFMVAFRFSHFLRRLLGEGTLQSIFIPHYEELRLQEEKKANAFFFRLYALLTVVLLTLIFLVESVVSFTSSTQNEVLHLFAWMFPSLLFISLYGINISLLQCKNAFFSSSVAPLACNLIWILAIFLFAGQDPSQAMIYLAVFTLIGFIIQWMITLPKTWNVLVEGKRHLSSSIFSIPQEVRTIGKATLFGLVGVTAVQMNSFLDMIFARYADIKGPIYLWYAIRLEQLPLALIGLACVYSITPSLSRHIKANALDKAQRLFSFGHKRILLLVIPCTFAIFALGFPSVNLLFGRGQFSLAAVTETTGCLWAYGIGLLSSTLTVYQSSLFYAYGDYKTPMIASFASVASNILLNTLFVFCFHLGALSIALSTSLSSWLNYLLLKKAFSQKGFWEVEYPSLSTFWKISFVSLIACVSCLTFDHFFLGPLLLTRSTSNQLVHFLGNSFIFIITFTLSLLLLYKEVFLEMKSLLFSREAPTNSTS